jgi:hypothetical protein
MAKQPAPPPSQPLPVRVVEAFIWFPWNSADLDPNLVTITWTKLVRTPASQQTVDNITASSSIIPAAAIILCLAHLSILNFRQLIQHKQHQLVRSELVPAAATILFWDNSSHAIVIFSNPVYVIDVSITVAYSKLQFFSVASEGLFLLFLAHLSTLNFRQLIQHKQNQIRWSGVNCRLLRISRLQQDGLNKPSALVYSSQSRNHAYMRTSCHIIKYFNQSSRVFEKSSRLMGTAGFVLGRLKWREINRDLNFHPCAVVSPTDYATRNKISAGRPIMIRAQRWGGLLFFCSR